MHHILKPQSISYQSRLRTNRTHPTTLPSLALTLRKQLNLPNQKALLVQNLVVIYPPLQKSRQEPQQLPLFLTSIFFTSSLLFGFATNTLNTWNALYWTILRSSLSRFTSWHGRTRPWCSLSSATFVKVDSSRRRSSKSDRPLSTRLLVKVPTSWIASVRLEVRGNRDNVLSRNSHCVRLRALMSLQSPEQKDCTLS